MFGKKHTCGPSERTVVRAGQLCQFWMWLGGILSFLATLLAAAGVYKAHFAIGKLALGTTSGSLALIAFVLSLAVCVKLCMKCCEKK